MGGMRVSHFRDRTSYPRTWFTPAIRGPSSGRPGHLLPGRREERTAACSVAATMPRSGEAGQGAPRLGVPLSEEVAAIGGQVAMTVHPPGGPPHLDGLGPVGVSQPEMQSRVARPTGSFPRRSAASPGDRRRETSTRRAHGVAVRGRPL